MGKNRAYWLIGVVLTALVVLTFYYKQEFEQNKGIASNAKPDVHSDSVKTVTLKKLLDSVYSHGETLKIKIDKSELTLQLLADSLVIREYPIVLGTDPVADKRMQGDRATPEGDFKVRAFYPHKSWSKFIWIDYPTAESYRKHRAAKAEGTIPKNASIGGEIGIHGVPNNNNRLIAEKQHWTWGCISMTNPDVEELFTIVYEGMPITIVP
ncbi:L,D-transpeptidase family protein [Maribacter sp. 2-571]|uniref:L,D-transpeptidase family protein n=1 Tax=Maribacter sp. 2-571 TaxID=3417569 RepID=UPI003D3511B5